MVASLNLRLSIRRKIRAMAGERAITPPPMSKPHIRATSTARAIWASGSHSRAGSARAGRVRHTGDPVLVRADGGPGIPSWIESLVRDGNGSSPLVLVDVTDRQHGQLRKWVRQRQDAYAARGWPGPGATPVEARVDDFLARRPQGGQP